MFIYIDESGTFSHSKPGENAYGCAGALTIPETRHGSMLKSFKTLTRRWGRIGEEIKGRELTEKHVAQVIDLLEDNEAKFHACATDMLLHPQTQLAVRKRIQADTLLDHVTEQHSPELRKKVHVLRDDLNNLSDQLFTQLLMMVQLINTHLRDMMVFCAVQCPAELASFRWIVDRKNDKETKYERIWKTVLPGFIQGRQFMDEDEDRIVFVEGGNYDYCQRFIKRNSSWPKHLPPPRRRASDGTVSTFDLCPVLQESFVLEDSRGKLGLQLVDIVTNALRRALVGNLQETGWGNLGRIMFLSHGQAVRLLSFCDTGEKYTPVKDRHAETVLSRIAKKAGSVI